MNRILIILGAFNSLLAVALGAFGAHGLKPRLSEDLYTVFQTGVHYHAIHALGLLLLAALASSLKSRLTIVAGWLLMLGILLFSGSLYLLAVTGIRSLGAITPFGGMAFLFGWGCLLVAAWRMR